MRKIMTALFLLLGAATVQAQAVTLSVPNILGVACGTYQSGSAVTIVGFDANGNIQGTVYEIMSCSSGGRGSTPHRYTGSSNITWDFRGGYITTWNAPLAIAAVGNGATDSYGNFVAANVNASPPSATLTINQMPPNPDYVEAVVPYLTGDTDAVASAAIAAAGLTYGYATINSTYPAPAGEVFNQSPQPFTLVPFGTVINLWETPTATHHHGGGGADN